MQRRVGACNVTLARRCVAAALRLLVGAVSCCRSMAASRWLRSNVMVQRCNLTLRRRRLATHCGIAMIQHHVDAALQHRVEAASHWRRFARSQQRRTGAVSRRRVGTASCWRSVAASCWRDVAAPHCGSVEHCSGWAVQRSGMERAHHHVGAASRWNDCSVALAQFYWVTLAQCHVGAALHWCSIGTLVQCSIALARLQRRIVCAAFLGHFGIVSRWRSVALVQHRIAAVQHRVGTLAASHCEAYQGQVGAVLHWRSVALAQRCIGAA